NAGNLFNFRDWTNTFNLLVHGGVGVTGLTPKEPTEKDGDNFAHFIVGITPQIRLGNHVALKLDGSVIGGFARPDYTFDGQTRTTGRGIISRYFTTSIGFDFYLGKQEKHADWYKSGNLLEDRVSALEDQV